MKTETIRKTGKKLIQIITKTPVKNKKNRLGKQYYISETKYIPISK